MIISRKNQTLINFIKEKYLQRILYRLFVELKNFLLRLYDNVYFIKKVFSLKKIKYYPNEYRFIIQKNNSGIKSLPSSQNNEVDFISKTMDHKFNLLGSGWIRVNYWDQKPINSYLKYFRYPFGSSVVILAKKVK